MSRKDEMVNDLKYLCSERCEISKETAKKIVQSISWEWTENRGGDGDYLNKGNGYYGCKYWSKKALEAVYEDLIEFKRKKGVKIRSVVTHEHVIPKNLFVNYIMKHIESNSQIDNLAPKTIDNNMLVGCIVTKEEDAILNKHYKSKMPDGITFPVDNKNVWERYRLANKNCKNDSEKITVYETAWKLKGKKLVIDKYEELKLF